MIIRKLGGMCISFSEYHRQNGRYTPTVACLRLYSNSSTYLDGVFKSAQVVSIGELDDRKLVVLLQVLDPLHM